MHTLSSIMNVYLLEQFTSFSPSEISCETKLLQMIRRWKVIDHWFVVWWEGVPGNPKSRGMPGNPEARARGLKASGVGYQALPNPGGHAIKFSELNNTLMDGDVCTQDSWSLTWVRRSAKHLRMHSCLHSYFQLMSWHGTCSKDMTRTNLNAAQFISLQLTWKIHVNLQALYGSGKGWALCTVSFTPWLLGYFHISKPLQIVEQVSCFFLCLPWKPI